MGDIKLTKGTPGERAAALAGEFITTAIANLSTIIGD